MLLGDATPAEPPPLHALYERLGSACGRKQAAIKEKCDSVAKNLKEAGNILTKELFSQLIDPVIALLESPQTTKQQLLSLQALERLVSHSNLTESIAADPSFSHAITVVTQAGRETTEETIQMQIVIVLRTVILSNVCSIHAQALMMAVRSCYQIYLFGGTSSAPLCPRRKLAHSALSEMLVTVFDRMEQSMKQVLLLPPGKEEMRYKDDETNNDETNRVEDNEASIINDIDDFEGPNEYPEEAEVIRSVIDYLIEEVEKDENDASSKLFDGSETFISKMVDYFPTEQTKVDSPRNFVTDSASLLRKKASQLQNDAYLLLRSLCKLSIKPLPSEEDDLSLKSKMFSLVLLNELLQHSGSYFRTSRRFVSAVKEFLLQSLLKNGVSHSHFVFQLSLDLFVSLIQIPEFKATLKTEIGVLLDTVFLGVAESPNSSAAHKLAILKMLRKSFCSEKEVIVDIFLNYDCDSGDVQSGQTMNIYEHICKVLETTSNSLLNMPEVRFESLQCTDELIRALARFHEQSSPGAEQSKNELTLKVSRASSPKSLSTGAWDLMSVKFERKRLVAADLQAGVLKFNQKPKHGLAYLHEKGVVDGNSAQEVAKFLMNTKGLDKQAIGEFMGGHQPFNLEVMYAYVDLISFHELQLDTALRKYLSGFRLPGESQVIDRMMEKFAERFCLCNPGLFATADVAYVLSYAIIMLNTDAHNPLLKHKDRMTKEQFISNNRGINDGKDLPREFLSEIYDRIVNDEIKMNDGSSGSANQSASKRQEYYSKEADRMMATTSNLLNAVQLPSAGASYLQSSPEDRTVVQPMFSALWAPVLVMCSMHMQGDNIGAETVVLCLNLYRQCIHLAAHFNMDVQRAAFINSLATHTLLGGTGVATSSMMQFKNIEAIRVMLEDVALKEGNFIRDSWSVVLRCVSELDRLHLIGTGAHPDAQFFEANVPTTSATDAANSASLMSSIEQSVIDRIFSRSSSLSAEGIVHFVDELCAVSVSELANARVYSLQKLVEITYYNMDRIRLVWSRIWTPIASHLTKAGQHQNLNIAIYSIDALRQLANKFLEKDELSKYEFQVQFLKPFDAIMRWTLSSEIREFIVQCLSRLVLSRVHNVKSGWKIVWSVFEESARDSSVAAAQLTLQTASRLLNEYCDVIMKGGQNETPIEVVQCLIAFVESRHSDLALEAIGLLELIAAHLHRLSQSTGSTEQADPPPGAVEDHSPRSVSFSEPMQSNAGVWLVALTGLSKAVGDLRLTVRTRALTVLQSVLRKHGSDFSAQTWRLLFNVVLVPIFSDLMKNPAPATATSNDQNQSEFQQANMETDEDFLIIWFSTTCLAALSSTIQIFNDYFEIVHFLLPQTLSLLKSVVVAGARRNNVSFAEIGIDCFVRLLQHNAQSFSSEEWTQALECMCSIMDENCSKSVLGTKAGVESDVPELLTTAAVLVLMMEMAEVSIAEFSFNWDCSQYLLIANCLDHVLHWTSSCDLSCDSCICARVLLSLSNVMISSPSSDIVSHGIRIFVDTSNYVMKHFILSDSSRAEYDLERQLVCKLLTNLSQMTPVLSTRIVASLYPILVDLIMSKDKIVRITLHHLFNRLYDTNVMPLTAPG